MGREERYFIKKQSGTLRLHLRVRRYADTSFLERDGSLDQISGAAAQWSRMIAHHTQTVRDHYLRVTHGGGLFSMHADTEGAGLRQMRFV
jgi:hypothetical protein